VRRGFYANDPAFPPRPAVPLVEPIANLGPDADSYRDPVDGQVKDASDVGQALRTFTAHRAPLGLVFDTAGAMGGDFRGAAFVLGYQGGDPGGETAAGPFKDPGQDLLHLRLARDPDGTYTARTTRIVAGFSNPIDAEIAGNSIYVLEYSGTGGLFEIMLPSNELTARSN
jgi:hypothetical protein